MQKIVGFLNRLSLFMYDGRYFKRLYFLGVLPQNDCAAGLTEEEGVVLIRISYPVVLLVGLALSFIHWQYARLMRLAEKIRNDK